MNRTTARLILPALTAIVVLTCVGTTFGQLSSAPIRDRRRIFMKETVSWKDLRESYVVMQQHEYSCGAAAVSTVIQYYWNGHVTEEDLLRTMISKFSPAELQDRVKNGLSMTDLRKGATELGYPAVIGTRTLSELYEVKVPIIVRLQKDDFQHFVVLRGIVGNDVYLADSIRGNITYTIGRFAEEWTDGAVLVIAKENALDLPVYSPLMVHCDETLQPEMQWMRSRINRRPVRPGP